MNHHSYQLKGFKINNLITKKITTSLLLFLNMGWLIAGPVSELKQDETLVFFNTSAWFNETTNQWHVPIHGWVFEPEDSSFRKNLIAKAMKATFNLEVSPTTQQNFNQRVNALLADNESNKSIVIRFLGRTYALPASAANGHFSKELLVDAKVFTTAGVTKKLSYQAVLDDDDRRIYTGQVNVITPQGLSIISDIDDTIKISEVTHRKQLMEHTFFSDFTAVPGMASFYQQWLQIDGSLHFVSSSPWQLYPALVEFIEFHGFPAADYGLKSFRFKDSTLLNLFAKSSETKPPQIINLLKRYPRRKFILVGDSGELDPEIYAKIKQQHPEQIIQILIRNVTNEDANNLRFQSLFKNLETSQWQLFTDSEEINFTP